jgi:hypothetical protein
MKRGLGGPQEWYGNFEPKNPSTLPRTESGFTLLGLQQIPQPTREEAEKSTALRYIRQMNPH